MGAWSARRPSVADVLTLGNALCGAAAILVCGGASPLAQLTALERFQCGAMLLLFATLFDVLDGAAARRWGGTALGGPLDSLADAISFGVAPVVIVVSYLMPGASAAEALAMVVGALMYVAAALVRLASFLADEHDELTFVGLPTTSACVAAVYLGFLSGSPLVVTGGLVLLAVLMVSPVTYPTGHRVFALCVAGWVLGFVAIIGLIEIRLAAALSILTIVVVVPLLCRLRPPTTSESAA